ncbi:MAG: DUF6036 family nucleotidyltransferase, partial [Halobaculum sp.]
LSVANEDQYTTGESLRQTFRRVGNCLNHTAEAYLIGGGAMTLRGIKDSTKDIDLVTKDRTSFRRIEAALLDLGYTQETELAREYESLGATAVLKGDGGGHVDLFDRQVALKLSFSETMAARAEQLSSDGNLTVFACSPVDVVLFKSMTPRSGDLDDVRAVIVAHGGGFDWGVLAEEFRSQLPLNAGKREHEWITGEKRHPVLQFEQTVRELDGVPKEVTRLVRETADVVEAEGFVVDAIRFTGKIERADLVSRVTESNHCRETIVDDAVERLIEKGVVETADGVCRPGWTQLE